MDDLIEALTIMRKYGNPEWPTHCEHDQLFVAIDPRLVASEDLLHLEELGFSVGDGDYEHGFVSFKFGSC